MPKNKFTDLNDHLFAELERLNDEDLKGDDLKDEIKRAQAISNIATNIVEAAKTNVQAMKLYNLGQLNRLPEALQEHKQLQAVS